MDEERRIAANGGAANRPPGNGGSAHRGPADQEMSEAAEGVFAAEDSPGNSDVERDLLGALIIDNDVMEQVAGFLESDHFFDPRNALIYAALRSLIDKNKAATPAIVADYLGEEGGFESRKEARDYLGRLAREAAAPHYAREFGRHIYDLAVRRGLIQLSAQIVEGARNDMERSPSDQIEAAEAGLYRLAERGRYEGGLLAFDDVLTATEREIVAARERGEGMIGLPTGLKDFDDIAGGLHRSDLIILAGRPAMGKTALATDIAFHIASRGLEDARKPLRRVAFFSLEMSAEQLAIRILSQRTGVLSNKIRLGGITAAELKLLTEETARLRRAPLYVDDTGGLSVGGIASRARRLKRRNGLDLVVIDYLQLISEGGRFHRDNRVHEVTMISRGLKALAKELDVPVLAVSQLSRQVENRDDKRPHLSDLRDSGAIEQDADLALFVYREEYYLSQQEPREEEGRKFEIWREKMEKAHGTADLIVGKHRHGRTGVVKLAFDKTLMKFSNLEPQARPDQA